MNPDTTEPSANPSAEPSQPQIPRTPQTTAQQHAPDDYPVGMSASQIDPDQRRDRTFNISRNQLLLTGFIGLAVVTVIFTALILTNSIGSSELKTVSYKNSDGYQFKLALYGKHGSSKTRTGNTQLVSKVSKDGKFPALLSISSGDASTYNMIKGCANYNTVLKVQNNNLKQQIDVCDVLSGKQVDGRNMNDAVYIAGILHDNKTHVITVGQDYSGIDLSNQKNTSREFLRFGLEPYEADIKRIISSIDIQ